jgi:hypothetical protein
MINKYLTEAGFQLQNSGESSNGKIYSIRKIGDKGVEGQVKNLIFGAKYNPDLIIPDLLNSTIEDKNKDSLVYNRPISSTGLK